MAQTDTTPAPFTATKPTLSSTAIQGSILGIVASQLPTLGPTLLALVGVTDPGIQQHLVAVAIETIGLLGALMAAHGRLTADTKLA